MLDILLLSSLSCWFITHTRLTNYQFDWWLRNLKGESVIKECSLEQKISHLIFTNLTDWTSWSWSWIELSRPTILRQLQKISNTNRRVLVWHLECRTRLWYLLLFLFRRRRMQVLSTKWCIVRLWSFKAISRFITYKAKGENKSTKT